MNFFLLQKRLSKKAQHIIEYIVLITIAAIAVIIIGPYVVRSWNASVKTLDDSVVDTFNDPLLETNELVPVLDCPSAIACPTAQLDIGSGLQGKYDRACPGEVRNPGCPSLYEGNPERRCQLGVTGSEWVKTDKYDDCTPIGCPYTCGLNIGAGLTGCFGPAAHGETDTISECGVGYVGSPTYTCNFGSWINLQNPCVVSCGNSICEPAEGENCATCPGDCKCAPGEVCIAGACILCLAGDHYDWPGRCSDYCNSMGGWATAVGYLKNSTSTPPACINSYTATNNNLTVLECDTKTTSVWVPPAYGYYGGSWSYTSTTYTMCRCACP